jgi:hypothetical protein
MTRVALVLAGFVAATTLFCPSSMAAPSDHPEALLSLLRAIDTIPTAEAIRETTRAPEQALRKVADDTTVGQYTRRRATSLLSLFPGKKASSHLRDLAHSTSERVRWVATYTFIRMHAKTAPRRARSFAQQSLGTSDEGRREAAVRGLRHVTGSATDRIVERHAKAETSKKVKAAIRRFRQARSR